MRKKPATGGLLEIAERVDDEPPFIPNGQPCDRFRDRPGGSEYCYRCGFVRRLHITGEKETRG